jgi:hypothetical protein
LFGSSLEYAVFVNGLILRVCPIIVVKKARMDRKALIAVNLLGRLHVCHCFFEGQRLFKMSFPLYKVTDVPIFT